METLLIDISCLNCLHFFGYQEVSFQGWSLSNVATRVCLYILKVINLTCCKWNSWPWAFEFKLNWNGSLQQKTIQSNISERNFRIYVYQEQFLLNVWSAYSSLSLYRSASSHISLVTESGWGFVSHVVILKNSVRSYKSL